MNIEQAKENSGELVVILESTAPYYYNDNGKKMPVNPTKIFPQSSYEIIGITADRNVQIYCLAKNKAEIIDPQHIELAQLVKATDAGRKLS